MSKSHLEATAQRMIEVLGLPEPETEFKFHDKRKWRFDFAWPEYQIFLEVEGGTWTQGRHNRGSGYQKDAEKYNEASRLGWLKFVVTTSSVNKDQVYLQILDRINFENKREAV